MATIKFISQTHPTKSGGRYKTTRELIDYITNPKKTEGKKYVSSQNCFINSTDAALKEMIKTKEFWGKTSDDPKDRMAYHFVISWSPEDEDITYEKAMQVAKEFCEQYLEGYEAVYCAHTDQEHIHVHIAFNSVNAFTGKKYRYDNYDWAKEVQPILDNICKKNGLKTLAEDTGMEIDEYLKEQKYKAWCKRNHKKYEGPEERRNNRSYHNDKNEKYSHRDFLRDYIDDLILEVNSLEEFFKRMKEEGFYVKVGKSEKHGDYFSVRGPGMDRAKRNYTLGFNYSMRNIQTRIEMKNKPLPIYPTVEGYVYMFKYTYWIPYRPGLTARQRRFYYGLYYEGLRKRGIKPNYKFYREAAKNIESLHRQMEYMEKYDIHSAKEVDDVMEKEKESLSQIEGEIKNFYVNRKPYMEIINLYMEKEKRKEKHDLYLCGNIEYKEEYEEYENLSGMIRKYNHTENEIKEYIVSMKEELKTLKNKKKECEKTIKDLNELKRRYEEYEKVPDEEIEVEEELPESYALSKKNGGKRKN